METIKLDLKNFFKEDIKNISSKIKEGKVLVLPTDTIYGLSGLAFDEDVIEKICDIKNRDRKKNLVVVMGDFSVLKKYCYLSERQYNFIKESFKKRRPITVILKGKNVLPKYLLDEKGGISIRIPVKSDFLIKVLKSVGRPLISTSLNISGKEELTDVKNLEEYFKLNQPDVVVDGGTIKGKSSKIVDIRNMDDIKVLRK